jgi:transcription initiation factor TFIIB
VEKAAYIYRRVQDRGLIRGRTISGIMAAAIYAACREIGTPYSLRDIAVAGKKKYECISRVANKANLTENTKREAIDIMKEVSKRHISAGKDPMGLAASVLYVSCLKTGEDRNQTEIANASGVTDVTLRNRYTA